MQKCQKWKKYFSTSYYNKFRSNAHDAKITHKKVKMKLI